MKNLFPWLSPDSFFSFPDPESSTDEGIVASGGNLSPGMLLSAYKQGIFPWFNEDEPLLWWSPDPRFVLFPDKLHISRSMKKLIKKNRFEVTYNSDFDSVIKGCRHTSREGQDGTWISEEMENGYRELYNLGYVVSVEVREKGSEELAAGLYGVRLGNCFFGESMFSRVTNGSKYGFISVIEKLKNEGAAVIDCQVYTSHLESLGAEMISRQEFLEIVKNNI
jgi:leucyl/phenylalanyl-tRNA--protein transferase